MQWYIVVRVFGLHVVNAPIHDAALNEELPPLQVKIIPLQIRDLTVTQTEALRALVRAREAGKQDQLRARHRLSKFLLRSGRRPAMRVKAWSFGYMAWVRQLRFPQMAQESTRLDYLHKVEHMAERVRRLEQAIAESVKLASPKLQAVIRGLQSLRGIAQISAVTIAAELGNITRFEGARQLMAYSGTIPSEDSSGQRTRRGSITKTGNAHLRRIAVEAA